MKRGEIWWAELPPPVGNRPVIILTWDALLGNIRSIVVALITRTIRQPPTEVVLGRRQGLPVPCVANLDNILTVPRHRLTRLMGACDAGKIEELNQAIKIALDVHQEKNLTALHVVNEAGGKPDSSRVLASAFTKKAMKTSRACSAPRLSVQKWWNDGVME